MQLYIANCSTRNHHLHYTLPEVSRMFDRHIAAGSQVALDLGKPEADAVVKQISQYGAVEFNKLGRNKDFSGLTYRFDKPIEIDDIRNGLDASDTHAIEQALQARTVGLLAADKAISETAQQLGTQVSHVSTEIREESKGPGDTGAKFAQTIEVVKQGRKPRKDRG